MKLELKDETGVLVGTIELPVEELREFLGLGSDSAGIVAQLKEALGSGTSSGETAAQLEESRGKVAELQEQLSNAGSRTMEGFTPIEKANFVIAWGRGLSEEDKSIFAEAVGISIAGAEVEEGKGKVAEGTEVKTDPTTILGKTDKPGYKYLEHLNVSVKE